MLREAPCSRDCRQLPRYLDGSAFQHPRDLPVLRPGGSQPGYRGGERVAGAGPRGRMSAEGPEPVGHPEELPRRPPPRRPMRPSLRPGGPYPLPGLPLGIGLPLQVLGALLRLIGHLLQALDLLLDGVDGADAGHGGGLPAGRPRRRALCGIRPARAGSAQAAAAPAARPASIPSCSSSSSCSSCCHPPTSAAAPPGSAHGPPVRVRGAYPRQGRVPHEAGCTVPPTPNRTQGAPLGRRHGPPRAGLLSLPPNKDAQWLQGRSH